MLMTESMAIGDMLKVAMTDRWGADKLADHYLAFDTICSATQDRQDAVVSLLHERDGRSDGGHRRLQQQQHGQSGPHLRRVEADLPHLRP